MKSTTKLKIIYETTMRFFGDNENETSVDTMHQHRTSSNTRKFGTPLRSNVDKSQRFVQSSLKKKVRVRRTPQPKPTNSSTEKLDSSTELLLPSTGKENTIVFLPGPVGLQLEPVNETPRYGCRVARFVDGGPNDPGQGRKCGGVKPGDLVLKVEAEGALLAATTYEEIINLLKLSHKKRIMTVQSVWDSNSIPEIKNRDGFIPTRRNNSTTTKKRDKEMMLSTPILSQLQVNDNGTPNFTIANDMIYLPPFQSVHQSSSQEEYSETSSIKNRTMLAAAEKAPIIIPLKVASTNFSSQQWTSVSSKGSSFHSQSTTESSAESTTLPSQSLADQFLLFDGFTGLLQPESSQVSSNSASSSIESTSIVDDTDSTKCRDRYLVNAKTPDQQPQISVPGDHCVNAKSQIQQQQDSFEHSFARADFEQRLEAARAGHSKTERELKDLYIHTCERNESKIRQLVVDKDSLQKVLDETKIEQTLLADTRFKQSERQVAELERIRTRIKIEAGAKIKDVTNEYSRKMVTKEEQWSRKYGGLEDETNNLRETLASKLMELDMSRTMITEMESRILAAEGEKDDISNRLQDAHKSIEELEDSIHRNKKVDEINSKEMLERVMNKNQGLAAEVESYESFKEESIVLTEKLVHSVQEKQKVINESQSFVFTLTTENDNLTKKIDEKTNDVEQLLQEKLLLEDKLAQTWKDYRKAKDDASTVHEFLLEKLENGEYFTSADVEEKEITIQLLSSELNRVKETLKDDLLKSTKRSVDLHLLLRGVEIELLEREESNIKISMERDMSKKRIVELEENLDIAKNQIVMATETCDYHKGVVNKLKEQAESISKSKEESMIYHQRSIDSISSKLEAKKSELLLCQDRLEEMQSLKEDEVATNENLRAQVEALSLSNEQTKTQYQKIIESISSGLESKKSELLSCQNRLEEIQLLKEKEMATNEDLKAQVELITKSKVEAEVQYQKSIELISSKLEAKKSEFVSCQNKLEEIQCLKEDEVATNENLRAQVEALSSSKEQTKLQYQKIIESVSSGLESKKNELLSCQNRLEDIHSLKEKEMATNEDLKAQVESITESKQEVEIQYQKSIRSISSKLEAKESEFISCQNKLEEMIYLKENGVAINENLRAKVEALTSSKEQTKSQYQKTLESVSSGLELKKNELLSCQNRLEEIHSLKEKEIAANKDLKTQVESIIESKREIEIQYQKSIKTTTSNLEAKESDLLSCRGRLNEAENSKTSLRKSNDELRHDLQTREQYLQQKVDHLETTLDQSEQELLLVKAKAKDLFHDCANLKTTGNDLKHSISSLIDEKERMTFDYQEDVDKNKVQLQAKEETVASLKEAETQLQKKVKSLNVEKERIENQSEVTIRTFEAGLQSQYEELSCTEMRLQILEEDYNILKSDQDKSCEEIYILILEKKNVESEHQETITKLNSELQSKHEILERTKDVLQQSIDKLSLESNEAGLRYRKDIEELTTKLELGESELSTTQAQLKNIRDTDLTAMEGLHKMVHSLTLENETASTQYWESMEELTTELQFETEKVSRKQSRLDDLEEEIQSYKTSLQEMNQHNFRDLKATIDSQTRLLDCSEFEKSEMGELNSALQLTIIDLQNRLSESSSAYSTLDVKMCSLSQEKTKTEELANLQQEKHRDETKYLQSKITSMSHSMQRLKMGNCGLQIKLRALMQDADEKLELQKKCDDLSASIAKLGVSNEKIAIDYCSEIFRLVKRLAVFEATHAEIHEQRKKAIADRDIQLHNKLGYNISQQEEEEQLISVELVQKATKELQLQNVMTSSLQAEMSSTLPLVKDLEDSKEIEFNALKAIIAGLHSELSSEKIAKAQSKADAFDEKMNLKILDDKYSLMLQSKDEALLRSENTRTTMARNLHDANAVLISLRVQLKEKDHKIEDALYDLQQTKVAANHKLDNIIESKMLRLELEKSTRTMLDLKTYLREAEDSAVKAQEFLTVVQSHLREKVTTQATEIGCLLDHNSSLKDKKLSADELLEKSKNDVKLLHQTIDELRRNLREKVTTQATEIGYLLDHNSSLKDEKLSADELLEKSKNDVKLLHQTIDELKRKLVDKGQNMDELAEELKDKELSLCRLSQNLQRVELDYQRHVTALKCHILSSRAAYINQNSQSKKNILKLRVHYVSKYLQAQTLEKKIAYFHQKENIAKEKIDDVNEVNASLKGEMEKMSVTINENKHQFEKLQNAMGALKVDLLIEEGNDKESKSRKKFESKEKTQLLRNIECLSTRLISMEESQRQSADFEESLKKNISKLRAEYVSKHLEVDALKKKYKILRHSNKTVEKKNTDLNTTMNELKVQENNNCILLENKEKVLTSISSEFAQLKVEKNCLEETHARFQEELNLSLSTKDIELTELQQASLELKNRLEIVIKQASEHALIREDEAERMTILKKERNTMAETISKNDRLLAEYSSSLESERSRFNVLLSQENKRFSATVTELKRCQESLDKSQNDFAAAISEREGLENQRRQLAIDHEISQNEVNDLQERFCQSEGMNKILRDNSDDARKTIIELEKMHHTPTMVQEELQLLQTQCDGKAHHILQLEDEIRSLREDLVQSEELMTESERDLQKVKDQVVNRECRIADMAMLVQLTASLPGPKSNDEQTVRSDSPIFDDVMSDHLNSVKDAFQKQKAVLDDVKLSEMVLQNFIDEAMELSIHAEAEMLELSSSIGTVDDLLLNPSCLLASLDLAGLDSSKSYFDEVRSRLEDMASLAYTTGLELKNRKKQLLHWRSNRTESPTIPVTPPSSKQIKNVVFDVNHLESRTENMPATTTSISRDILWNQVAGARLLCCVMEKRNRTDLASTLRKWTSLTCLTNASSSHKETAIKLAHQLEITREKLLVLKSNLKGQRKPKLRRILEQLEHTQHECSFEI